MNGSILSKLYGLNMMVIEKNLEGITTEESFVQPQAAGNCVNWVLGHIVATRNQIMELIGENPTLSEVESAPYKRGSKPLTDRSTALTLEKMFSDLQVSQDKLMAALQGMPSEELEAPFGESTKYEQLAVLQFHEAYHAGQLGILRRFLGKPGAIK